MDRFMIASNPLKPEHGTVVVDTVKNVWWTMQFSAMEHGMITLKIAKGTAEDASESQHRAFRWLFSYCTDILKIKRDSINIFFSHDNRTN